MYMEFVLPKEAAGRLQRNRGEVDVPDLNPDGLHRPVLPLLACRRRPRQTFELP
jgi:hypothetical protein